MHKIAIALGIYLLAINALGLLSCEPIKQVDDWIWQRTAPADAVPDPDPAPPILELLASGLALAGYGGMATWIHRSGKTGRRRNADTIAELNELAATVARLEKSIGPPA